MAQLLIIKAETVKQDLQYIGDVVLVASDDHIFSDHELTVFNVLRVNGTKEDVKARLAQLTPRRSIAYLWSSDNTYHFAIPEDGNVIEETEVYQVDNKWYRLVSDFKFPVNVDELTAEEKQLLETVDINHPSVDSFINKVIKDFTSQPGNGEEIKDLRNQTP